MKSAIQLIREADRGQLLSDFEEALQDIVNAIEEHGGKGVIKITLGLTKRNDAYMIESKLDHVIPQAPRAPAIMFFNADQGEFSRADPRQPVLPVVVDAETTNARRFGRNNQED